MYCTDYRTLSYRELVSKAAVYHHLVNVMAFTIMQALSLLLQRKILLPILSLLYLTAPWDLWPVYSASLFILSFTISCMAHLVFRRYQLAVTPQTLVNTLMILLSVFLQVSELQITSILLLRFCWQEESLSWYQTHPQIFSILLGPR